MHTSWKLGAFQIFDIVWGDRSISKPNFRGRNQDFMAHIWKLLRCTSDFETIAGISDSETYFQEMF